MQKIKNRVATRNSLDPYFRPCYNALMRIELISIGTELLLGAIVNTNAAYLSQKLAENGIDVYRVTTVGDNPERLTEAIREACERADAVVMTGGLGPTVDDITAQTVARLIGKHSALKQIRNDVGTAPGLIVGYRGKEIICLPGPPRELVPMFEKDILPYLKNRLQVTGNRKQEILKSRTIKLTGLPESLINNKVKDLLALKPPTTVGIYAKLGQVELKVMAKSSSDKAAKNAISGVERKIRARLKDYIFGCDNETLEGAVGKALLGKKKKVAVAESCTGGLVSSRLTDVSGSSKYFAGGIIAYSNDIKVNILGVAESTLKKFGAVSPQVALQMADGIRRLTSTDIGLAITGIAGPTGGTKTKPVGLVYVALTTERKRIVREFRFRGSREEVKFQSSQVALELVRKNA